MRNTDEDGVSERLVDFGVTASSTISGGASSCILVKYLKTGLLPDLQHSESSTITVTLQNRNMSDTTFQFPCPQLNGYHSHGMHYFR